MRRILPSLLLFALSLLLVPHPVAAQGGDEGWLLTQLNTFRAQNGRGGLAWNGALAAAAQAQAQYLANNPYVGPHVQANGSTPQDRAAAQGYGGRVGENVVGGSSATLEWGWTWWAGSAVHRNNMLGDWNEVGIAVGQGSYGRWYTMVFGNNGQAAAPPAPAPVSAGGGEPTRRASVVAQPPRPTQPPPPTATPTITYTPSITFTPRASYTPLPTTTWFPASATPIVIDLVVGDATAVPVTPTAESAPPSSTAPSTVPTVPAVAVLPTLDPLPSAPITNPAPEADTPLRTLIPILLAAQALLIGGLALRAAWRRMARQPRQR
jgi:Cysteine-rich secretory protein family